jgi:hypothetical protein
LGPVDAAGMILFSALAGTVIWGSFDPRSLVLFVLCIGMGEIFVYLRWRQRMVCRHCGFDPVLYNISPNRARDKVKIFYEARMQRPEFLLSQSPLLELRKRLLEQERLKQRIQRVKGRSFDSSFKN